MATQKRKHRVGNSKSLKHATVKSSARVVLKLTTPLNDLETPFEDAAKRTSIVEKARAALNLAKKLQREHATWVEANNKLYGVAGILTQLFPTPADRAAFIKTKESAAIRDILESLPEPKAQVGRPRSEVNGKILARVPKTVHAALLAEAEAEGVSLNQLLVSKLSVQLRAAV